MQKTGVALAVGVAIGLCFSALAARNSTGTYSLPTGNPVVTGSTISSTWANSTLTDIKTEITNSLDRNGRGAMLAPLQLSGGTSSAPALTFSSETNSGIYRASAGDIRLQVGGTNAARFSSSAITLPLACTISGGLTVTQSASDTAGIASHGAGTGSGIIATGGNGAGAIGGEFYGGVGVSGTGVYGEGTGSAVGVFGKGGPTSGAGGDFRGGSPNGRGAVFTGAGTGSGISSLGGGTNGWGARLEGSGTGYGAAVYSGTTASASARSDALYVVNGDVYMGEVNPNKNVGFTNRLTPKNVPKAWARVFVNTTGAPSIVDGFNVTSCVTGVGSGLHCSLASPMADTNYSVVATGADGATGTAAVTFWYHGRVGNDVSTVDLGCYIISGSPPVLSACSPGVTNDMTVNFQIFGAQ